MASITAVIEHLSPDLETAPVLKQAEIAIEGGMITCLVGPSGSGKSTLLRLLSGDGGLGFSGAISCSSNGKEHSVAESARLGQVGILVPEAVLPPWLTIREILQMPSRLNRNLRMPTTDDIAKELAALSLGSDVIDKHPGDLSMGMHHRVLLSLYFLYSPAHVFIDELFSALDPTTANIAIRRLKDRVVSLGATCLVTTHDLELADKQGDMFYYKWGAMPTLEMAGRRGGCRQAPIRTRLMRLFDEDYRRAARQ